MKLDVIVQADALTYLAGLPSASVDMVLTSPPYDNLRKYGGYTWDFEGIACELYRVIKPGGVVVWVVGDSVVDGSETLSSFEQAIYFKKHVGFLLHDTMIWEKDACAFPDTNRYYQMFEYMFVLSKGKPAVSNLLTSPNKWAGQSANNRQRINGDDLAFNPHATGRVVKDEGIMPNVWRIPNGYGKGTRFKDGYRHPAMFPERLAERHVITWTNPGDVVLDCFTGSGTTAIVARRLHRHYIGCDVHEPYVRLARERLAAPWQPVLAGFA